ncbi:hypothetical protein WDV06_18995 [Streptomyces racemochromogenes]|uniref:Uncharacterized protein n=1 Tax=Streptomyces racemochromogenes TaxID=67353 RepID=A0ABW7PGL8_9ACTN
MTAKKRTSAASGAATTADGQEQLIASAKQYIRTHGSGFLKDPNISSIGIGYRETKGRRTKELTLQFTVDTKVTPEGLAPLNTTQIPPVIDLGGGRTLRAEHAGGAVVLVEDDAAEGARVQVDAADAHSGADRVDALLPLRDLCLGDDEEVRLVAAFDHVGATGTC